MQALRAAVALLLVFAFVGASCASFESSHGGWNHEEVATSGINSVSNGENLSRNAAASGVRQGDSIDTSRPFDPQARARAARFSRPGGDDSTMNVPELITCIVGTGVVLAVLKWNAANEKAKLGKKHEYGRLAVNENAKEL